MTITVRKSAVIGRTVVFGDGVQGPTAVVLHQTQYEQLGSPEQITVTVAAAQ